MNIASAQMLQDSLQNLGNTFQRNRQLDAENAFRQAQLENEAKRTQVEQSFRDAQMQHYNTMEEHQADSADAQNKRLDAIEKKYGVQQAYQDLQTAQGNITKGMQGLSLDKNLPPEEKTAYLQQSIDAMPDNIKTSMLQNPQINALYQGKGDWDAVAAAVQAQMKNGDGQRQLPADEDEVTIDHPAVLDQPATPPVHHWFKPDEPGTPAVPGTPAYKEVIRRHLAAGSATNPSPGVSPSDVNSQVQGAVSNGAPAAASAGEGQTATNPKTGAKVVFKNGAWQPLAANPSAPATDPGSQPIQRMILPNGQLMQPMPQMQLDRYRFLRNKLATLGADHVSPNEADEMTSLENSLGLDFFKPVPDSLPTQPIQGGGGYPVSMPYSMPPNYSGQ